jgi:hypothetical protein
MAAQVVASRAVLSSTELVSKTMMKVGAPGSVVAKALCYKPEGRGFETR